MYRFQTFSEMRTYLKDLKRFRPLIHPVVVEIEKQKSSSRGKDYESQLALKKRRLIIRDWWQMALWYVRLKKAAKGQTPFKLLDIQATMR